MHINCAVTLLFILLTKGASVVANTKAMFDATKQEMLDWKSKWSIIEGIEHTIYSS